MLALTPSMIEPTVKFVHPVSGVRKRASVRNTEWAIRWLLFINGHELRSCVSMDPVAFEMGSAVTISWFASIVSLLDIASVTGPRLALKARTLVCFSRPVSIAIRPKLLSVNVTFPVWLSTGTRSTNLLSPCRILQKKKWI